MMAAEQGAQQLCKSTVSMRAIVSAAEGAVSAVLLSEFVCKLQIYRALSSIGHKSTVGSGSYFFDSSRKTTFMTNQSSQALTACVFCGSRPGADPRFCDIAALTGKALAERGINVVFGGGNSGLMGIVSQTALQGGVRVTGVIPEFLKSKEPPADNLTRLITVADMHERKRTMADLSDFFIALPGGIGTFEEIFEVITNNTIGVFNKPAGFFNFDGYYDTLFQFMDQSAQAGFLTPQTRKLFNQSDKIDELIDLLAAETLRVRKAKDVA